MSLLQCVCINDHEFLIIECLPKTALKLHWQKRRVLTTDLWTQWSHHLSHPLANELSNTLGLSNCFTKLTDREGKWRKHLEVLCVSAYFTCVFVCLCVRACVCVCACVLPGHGWGLQSWYSTGDPLQAFGEFLPSMPVQVRLRER